MNAINAMDTFHDFYHVGRDGSGIGLVFSIYTVGSIFGSFVGGVIVDYWGRRVGMGIGSAIILVGTVVQATGHTLAQFIVGRTIMGFGVPIAVTGAVVYMVELAYPTWRGLCGGLYNVFGWYIGALAASWSAYGTGFMKSNWSFRIPIILQAIPSLIVISTVWFIPESPRWLYAQKQDEKARAILVYYHGNGNPDSAVVELEINEIRESLGEHAQESQKRWWDYRQLINSRPARYRMWIIMLVSVFSQFVGGAVISYYMSTILESVGITSNSQQLLMNGINTILSFGSGIAGSFAVDRIGRRPLLVWGTILTGLTYIPLNVLAAKANGHIGQGAGYAFIAMIFLYGIFFSFCWSPLQALYPAEVLNNEIRAKGMAAQSWIGGIASFINTYATPIALKNIGWKTYTIFLVLHFVHAGLMWLFTVETMGRSLEELEEIFNDPHPVKRSLQKTKIVLKEGVGAKVVEDME